VSTRHKTWIAVAVEFVSLAGLAGVFIQGGPVLAGWVLVGVFDASALCSLYFLTQWRDELK
jgi:hypothetical protein